jgi:primosomal protein N' (replication factor Y)
LNAGRVFPPALPASPALPAQYNSSVFVRVAVPVPQLDLLTYSIPDGTSTPSAGVRVIVPLGPRMVTGIVVSASDDPPDGIPSADVRPIRQILDETPLLPAGVVALASWTAEYYAAGIGQTITAVLPPKARGHRADAHKTRRVAAVTAAGLDAVSRTRGRQREALNLLAAIPEGIAAPDLARRGISAAVISRLAALGLVALRQDRVERDPLAAPAAPVSEPEILTGEQSAALTRLRDLANDREFKVALLHGVTGSGKTEIYRRLALHAQSGGRQVLILVPEIALTPAVVTLFRGTFGDRVAIQHSGLSDGERHDQWQRIRRGEVDIVIGTRSAVFSPLDRTGLIVVDEEHDASYKQDEAPRYNGRDIAIVLGRQSAALVVLGSATPSIETYHNATTGKYEHLVLERRILDRPLASVTVVDMRTEYAASGPDVVISSALAGGLHTRLERGEQSLVLLNRRGFATAMFCRQCAGTLDCPNCSVSLVVHGEGKSRRMRCHYCNHAAPAPSTCPACAAPYMEQAGFGTERVEREVARICPEARVARLDRDTIRRKGALSALLTRFQQGDIDVLVGTQMIAKGHDFPRVTLVGVVSADVGLGMADFRASERTFQLLTQVAGRAGRGSEPGEAIIQTLYPEHYSIQFACRQDYPAFFEREVKFRRAMRYPPVVALINVVVKSQTLRGAMADAAAIADRIRRTAVAGLQVLGPAPAALAKLRGEYRAQLLVKGSRRRQMREAVITSVSAQASIARRTIVDVDPLSVL